MNKIQFSLRAYLITMIAVGAILGIGIRIYHRAQIQRAIIDLESKNTILILEGESGIGTPVCLSASSQLIISSGKDGADALITMLGSDKLDSRRNALILLGKMGARAACAVPRLIDMLGNLEMPTEVIHTLGEIGPCARLAVPVLQRLANGRLELSERGVDTETSKGISFISKIALRKIMDIRSP